jgi:hypothetical protein
VVHESVLARLILPCGGGVGGVTTLFLIQNVRSVSVVTTLLFFVNRKRASHDLEKKY